MKPVEKHSRESALIPWPAPVIIVLALLGFAPIGSFGTTSILINIDWPPINWQA
jgi:hypothetical protein